MKRHCDLIAGFGLLFFLLLPGAGAAASPPAESLFKGKAVVTETGGSSLKERASQACRRWEKAGEGSVFFTAWAFPSSERIDSCSRHRGGVPGGTLTVMSRDGRIRVSPDRGLSLADGRETPGEKDTWGVMLLLYKVEGGRGRACDVRLLAPDRAYELGGERLAWLGVADEAQALDFIRGLMEQGADRELGHDLVFAVYLVRGQAAVSELIALARRDPSPEVRKQAIFWLGQKASAAAVAALGEVIDAPEALEIKKQAVFALSQLPEDKGTPLLLRIARANPHPRLRKEAIFWLGESGDPRALQFFEEILLK